MDTKKEEEKNFMETQRHTRKKDNKNTSRKRRKKAHVRTKRNKNTKKRREKSHGDTKTKREKWISRH